MMSEHYVTIGDFTAGIGDGLSFSAGKEVSVITKNPSGWWYVEMDSNEGWVPSSYLEKVFSPSGGDGPKKPPIKDTKPEPAKSNKVETPVTKPSEIKSTFKPQPVKPKRVGREEEKPAMPVIKSKLKESASVPMDTPANKPTTGAKPSAPFKPSVATKPKPAIPRLNTVTVSDTSETTGTSSVAAMAAALSKGLGKKSTSEEEVSNPVKPSVPKRTVPVKGGGTDGRSNNTLTVKRDSLKRSSSTDDIESKKTKSPPLLKPRPNEFIPPPQRGSKSTSSSPQAMGRKFLRKSTENLTEIDEGPTPPPTITRSTGTLSKPDRPHPPPARTFTRSTPSEAQTRPPPTSPHSNNTIKLAELEKSLSKKPLSGKRGGPSPPLRKNNGPSAPPKRPQAGPNKSGTQTKKVPPPRPSTSPAQSRKNPSYVTISDYSGDEGSLSFREGESVEVLEKSDEGWWYVTIKGKEGWVPSTFIEATNSKPDRPNKPPQPVARKPGPGGTKLTENSYRAISDYSAPVYEDSGLNLKEGEIYEVVEKTDGGWWYIQYNDKEGWAPSSFLEPAK